MTEHQKDNNFIKTTTIASVIGGMTGKFICHPIDTLRAKIQVSRDMITIEKYREGLITQTFKHTIKTEGMKGLFKGMAISVLGTGPAFSLYLTSYEWSKRILAPHIESQSLCYLVSGFVAETISCIFWLPIDVVKERMQVQSNLKFYNYTNTFDAIKTILKTEGVVGLYRAYGATLASFGPFSALYFLFYEKLKIGFCANSQQATFLESLTLAGLAGSMAGFLVNPLEVVKLRMQVQRASTASGSFQSTANFGYRNVAHGLYKLIQTEGFLSIYKGSLAKILYSTPCSAISMSVSEVLREYLRNGSLKY